MTTKPRPDGGWTYGPTAETVAANVAAFRARNGLSLRDLSAVLGGIGRPITPAGLSKVENTLRRVDVDDLTALAFALQCSPAELLTPQGEPGDVGALTGAAVEPAPLVYELQRWVGGGIFIGSLTMLMSMWDEQREVNMRVLETLSATLDIALQEPEGADAATYKVVAEHAARARRRLELAEARFAELDAALQEHMRTAHPREEAGDGVDQEAP